MKNFPYLLILFFLALSQFSCTSRLHFEVTRPAKVSIGHEQRKVMVINRLEPKFSSTNSGTVAIAKAAAHEAFLGAVEAVRDDGNYVLVHMDWLNYTAKTMGETDQKLSKDQVQEIYRQHPHHLLMVLEDFNLALSQLRLYASSTWALYDSTGTVLDEITLEENEYIRCATGLNNPHATAHAFRKAIPKLHPLARNTGYKYWQRLSPRTSSYSRHWYSVKKLKEAESFIAVQDWESAISILLPLAQSNEKHADKAAYNLAVVYEASGSIDEAKFWASQALNKTRKPTEGYLVYEMKSLAKEVTQRNVSAPLLLLLELENSN
jgi:tetratricopeptide (TPR) repeat protein